MYSAEAERFTFNFRFVPAFTVTGERFSSTLNTNLCKGFQILVNFLAADVSFHHVYFAPKAHKSHANRYIAIKTGSNNNLRNKDCFCRFLVLLIVLTLTSELRYLNSFFFFKDFKFTYDVTMLCKCTTETEFLLPTRTHSWVIF